MNIFEMNWFSGNIADAVQISKEKNVIFMVFIDGKFGVDKIFVFYWYTRVTNMRCYYKIRLEISSCS